MVDQTTVVQVNEAARGARGLSAYQVAVNNGFVGTEAEWLLSLGVGTETLARIAADAAIQAELDGEEAARAAADTTLQTNIDNEATTRLTNDNAEITARTNADAAEATARGNADTTLQNNINTEATTRGNADTTLQTNITAETTARTNADLLKLQFVTTRGALAAAPTTIPAYLTEAGREGSFVFDGSNLSAKVAADGNQGVYVAKSTDATGASGAWVRKSDGPISPCWFGATADNATVNAGSTNAALTLSKNLATGGFGYSIGGASIRVPHGAYYQGVNTFDVYSSMRIEGESVGGSASGGSSVMRWGAGATGIRVQRFDTSGAGGASNGHANDATLGGNGTILSGLFLEGAFAAAEGEFYGIQGRAAISVRDCYLQKWEGDAVRIVANSGGVPQGEASSFGIDRVFTQLCRNGLYVDGGDANIGLILGLSAVSNRQWGVWDSSFLGNVYIGCHSSGNGLWGDGTAGKPASATSYSGNRYFVKVGQEIGASTNAPSGAATSNTWWGYWQPGAAATGIPAWVTGMAWRAGGSYATDIAEPSACHVFVGCYAEGDQPPAQFGPKTLTVGGILAEQVAIYGGAYVRAAGSQVEVNALISQGNATVFGVSSSFGPQTGVASDSNLYLDCTGVHSFLNFRKFTAGSPSTFGFIDGNSNFGLYYTVANGLSHVFQIIGVGAPLTVSATGISVTGAAAVSGAVTGSNLSGTNTGDETSARIVTALATNALPLSKLAAASGASFIGATAAGNFAEQSVASARTILGLAAIATSGSAADLSAGTILAARMPAFAGGDVTSSAGSLVLTVGTNRITRAMQAQAAAASLIGATAPGNVSDLTPTQVTALLNAATTGLQGMMSAEDKTRLNNHATFYRSLIDSTGSATAALAAATYLLGQGVALIPAAGGASPPNILFIDSADYPAVGTLTAKLRLRVNLQCNDVAPGVTFTIGLRALTRPGTSGGAGLNIYTVGAAIADVVVATPAADSQTNSVSADFALPANGYYAIAVVTSGGAIAASAHVHISAMLQMHYT